MLTSVHNELVKHVVALKRRKEREEAREFAIEGLRLVREGLLRRAPLKRIFYTPGKDSVEELLTEARRLKIPCQEVSEHVLAKMSSTETPQGILAVVQQHDRTWDDVKLDSRLFLVIDGIQDPGNLGSILRTALACGITEVCLTQGTVDLYNPKVLRSTMGAIFAVTALRDQTPERVLEECRKRALNLLVADMGGDVVYETDIKEKLPVALVVGNEGNGPSPLFKEHAALKVAIPMANEVESLNVGVATAVLLYEMRRQLSYS